MDRSWLFRFILQPLTGRFMDAFVKITGRDIYREVGEIEMWRSMSEVRPGGALRKNTRFKEDN